MMHFYVIYCEVVGVMYLFCRGLEETNPLLFLDFIWFSLVVLCCDFKLLGDLFGFYWQCFAAINKM